MTTFEAIGTPKPDFYYGGERGDWLVTLAQTRAGSAWHGKPQTTRMHAHPMTDRERNHAWQQAYRKGDPRW